MRFMRHEQWADALFVHYAVDAAALQSRLPSGLRVHTHEGIAYVGLVLLSEEGIVPLLPGLPLALVRCFALSHHAVNVRTYVLPASGDGPPGIFFFTLDCSALLPVLGARALFNLPYRYARMSRRGSRVLSLESDRVGSGKDAVRLSASWVPGDSDDGDCCNKPAPELREGDAALGRFFAERYALYCTPGPLLRCFMGSSAPLWCGTITHEAWPLVRARLVHWEGSRSVLAAVGLDDLVKTDSPPVVFCSRGVGPIEFFWRGKSRE